jgi:zinc protease
VRLHYKGPAFSTTAIDQPALILMSQMLFSETSDLYQKLVVKEQKARSLFGGAPFSRDPNLISISASVKKPEDMQYVKDEITKALEAAKTAPADARKLAETKSRIKYSLAMSLDNPDQIANSLASFIWLTGNPESINQYYALFEKVTAEDIMNAARKYFRPEGLTIATIGPDETGNVK